MLKKLAIAAMIAGMTTSSMAEDVIITGVVTSKCSIHTTTSGVYGNPTQDVLSTAQADGGVQPVVRYDVVQGGFYKAVISVPTYFTSSPTLTDSVSFTGSVDVSQVSDSAMSAYTTNKRTYNNVSEFDLTVGGTTWFQASSTASYGVNKSFPAGTYRAVVTAECIAL